MWRKVIWATQPSIPPVLACLAGVKEGYVHLCQVAGNTVWSHMAGDAPYLCDRFPI